MSRDASITISEIFGDGHHTFRMAIGQLRELQEKTGVSPFAVLARLIAYLPMVDDAPEIIRLGLIGGGMAPPEAVALTERYARQRPSAESIPLGTTILKAGLLGVPDEKPGKSAGEAEAPVPPPTTG